MSVMKSVDQRTNLVGQNRLELLTFKLKTKQRYGINVFKVREVMPCPHLSKLPQQNNLICGVAQVRGQTMSVVDLNSALGGEAMEDYTKGFIIISEFNSKTQAFLVDGVDRIVNLNWEEVLPPPAGMGKSHKITGVTHIDDEIVEILDVESILAELSPGNKEVDDSIVEEIAQTRKEKSVAPSIMIVDDSSVARNQIKGVVKKAGFDVVMAKDGKEAINMLNDLSEIGNIEDQLALVISDIEMPEMDGYTLTAEIRKNEKLKGLHVILHTSLSGVFNQAMVETVGADDFISKFDSDMLGGAIKSAVAA